MHLWKISLGILVCMLPIGVVLRFLCDSMTGNQLSWTKDSKIVMSNVKKKNSFMWLLLCLEGIISNLSLVALAISVPLYFIFHV
jgi:hypothetical protein